MRNPILLVAMVVACGGGGEGGGLGTTRAITEAEARPLCSADCQHDLDCGEPLDLAMCTEACVDEFAGWARADAVDTMLRCEAALACTDLDETCFALVAPLAIHDQFEAMCRSNLTCAPELDCEVSGEGESSFFRLIAPEIMTDINACFGMGDCTMQIQCIQAQLELHNISF